MPDRTEVYKVALGAVLTIAIGIGAYGAYYYYVGMQRLSRPEPGVPTQIVFVSHPYAWVLVAAAGILLLGLSLRQLWLAWIAAVLISIFSAMNVFNIGILLIPISILLLLLLGLMTWTGGDPR